MQQANFSYSTDYESPNNHNQFIIVDIIEDASSSRTIGFNNYTKSQLYELSSAHHQINHRQEKQDKMQTTNDKASHHLDNSESDCIIGENIEMEASLVDLSGISSQTTCNNITSICQDNTKCEKVMTCEQQPDITPPTTDNNTQQQDAMKDEKNLTSIVEPIHIEAFSVEPSYSRGESNNLSSPKLKSNEIRLEPLIEIPKHHHPLSFYSNSSHSSSSNTTSGEDTFYTLDCSLSNLNHHEEHSISSTTPKQENSKQTLEFNSTLHLLQSMRDEQSKTQLASLHSFNTPIHVENLLGSNNFSSDASLKNPDSLQFEKNSKTPNQELVLNHSHRKMMRFLNITAFAVLDISFVIGAALFVAGCGLLIANNVTYFFSGILLFIIGSVLFLVGPLGKTLVDLINLIRHFRWEKKVKQVTNLQSESSKTLKDQMHELHQDITSYRPSDLPPLKMIILELVNDFFLIIGGLTFTIGSSLYMLNPPMLIVIIAEVNWSVGAVSYLIVSIIQYIVKQVDIIKSARNGMDINVKCFTFMSIDLSAYLLNIASSLLFTIGSGCFLVNERSLEITGEVIWSLGCIAMIIAVFCNRIIWIKSTWFERQDSSINV